MRTVVFDLDGTLADTSADLIAAANACFRDLGHGDVLDPKADAATAFRGGRAMLRLGLSRVDPGAGEDVVDAQYPRLLTAYEADIDRHTALYPGALAAIAQLHVDGYKVGVCTNKPHALADTLLFRLGVRGMFDALVGAGTLDVSKPDPAPYRHTVALLGGDMARSLLVGDTVTDRETARAAGVASVLVTFGPEGDRVAKLEPEALLPHYDQLGAVVARLIG
ncbi:MAG: HAD-IA family hydrolase [Alphaproteobacteria bacterium]|nr:HAD-IA family hydrolase [Alphaproteobacteria bacterium]NNF25302.1 HAD-IA family hydrolase [Paracoccaceae bacterium]